MNLYEFLSDPAVALPIKRDTEDFERFVTDLFDGYLQKLDQLDSCDAVDEANSYRDAITDFCSHAKEVIRATFAGRPSEAYEFFVEAVTPIKAFIYSQSLTDQRVYDIPMLYRVRRESDTSLTREDMFHIPFEKRHRICTQRYSIPGLPCLYLSGSLYTCWAEMGRPPFHELAASAFWLRPHKTIKVLNLCTRPTWLLLDCVGTDGKVSEGDPIYLTLVKNHLILWPFIAMCSIVVKHRNSPYKSEYIFPQTVLQWVTKEFEFDAISYFSTHVDAAARSPLPTANFVFPVRDVVPTGRCDHLRSLFKMTKPQRWDLLRAVNAGWQFAESPNDSLKLVFLDDLWEPYRDTEFGMVEKKLDRLAMNIMQRNKDGEPDLGDVLP